MRAEGVFSFNIFSNTLKMLEMLLAILPIGGHLLSPVFNEASVRAYVFLDKKKEKKKSFPSVITKM